MYAYGVQNTIHIQFGCNSFVLILVDLQLFDYLSDSVTGFWLFNYKYSFYEIKNIYSSLANAQRKSC